MTDTVTRDRIITAMMELLAEESFEQIGLSDIAKRAGVTLAQLRQEFSSTLSIIAAHVKDTDIYRAVRSTRQLFRSLGGGGDGLLQQCVKTARSHQNFERGRRRAGGRCDIFA